MRRVKVAARLVSQCDRAPYTWPPGPWVVLSCSPPLSQHRGPETGQSQPSSVLFLGAFGVLS